MGEKMIITFILGIALATVFNCSSPISGNDKELVRNYCENELFFEDTRDFESFVSKFYDLLIMDSPATNWLPGPFFKSNEMLKRCHRDREAIMRLGQLISAHTQDDVCQPDHIDMITDYHNNFIKNEKIDQKAPNFDLDSNIKDPIVRQFFTIYALQVSHICKRNLLSNLHHDLKKLGIGPHDYENLTPWLERQTNSATIDSIVKQPQSFDDLLIPDFQIYDSNSEDLIYLTKEQRYRFELMQDVCQNKIRPIYETTIMPVVRLAKLGYSYRFSPLDKHLIMLRNDADARRMYTATQICIIFTKIRIVKKQNLKFNSYLVEAQEESQDISDNLYAQWPRHSSNSFGPHMSGSDGTRLTIIDNGELKQMLEEETQKKTGKTTSVSITNILNNALRLVKEKITTCRNPNGSDYKETLSKVKLPKNRKLVIMHMFQSAMRTEEPNDKEELLADLLVMLTSKPSTTKWEKFMSL